jgi:hypothetical protein
MPPLAAAGSRRAQPRQALLDTPGSRSGRAALQNLLSTNSRPPGLDWKEEGKGFDVIAGREEKSRI